MLRTLARLDSSWHGGVASCGFAEAGEILADLVSAYLSAGKPVDPNTIPRINQSEGRILHLR